MNKSLTKARGKHIAFLNSDDYWNDPQAVAFSVAVLEETGSVFSCATCTVVTPAGKKAFDMAPQIGHFFCCHPFSHQTMFTLLEHITEMGGFNETFSSAADYDFIVRSLMQESKPIQMPRSIATFGMGGFSSAEERYREEAFHVLRKNFGMYLSNKQIEKMMQFRVPQNFIG